MKPVRAKSARAAAEAVAAVAVVAAGAAVGNAHRRRGARLAPSTVSTAPAARAGFFFRGLSCAVALGTISGGRERLFDALGLLFFREGEWLLALGAD